MKKVLPVIAFVFLSAVLAFSQDTKPTPKPTPTDDTDVVKISTNLIQIDVSVTDAKGKVITDLKPEEIEIYENGQKQKISNFSFISNSKTVTEKQNPATAVNTDIPVPQAVLRPEQIHRTVALVVDDLSLSFESAYQTRRALKKFVDEQMQDGDLVAIIRTGAGIGALQQFTSDKRILYAAIEKVKWNPSGNGGLSAFAPIEPTPLETLKATGDSTISEEALKAEKNKIDSINDFRGGVFASGTLGALKYIVTGMAQLPGRKSVILFSDGFKLFEKDEMGIVESGRVLDFLQQLIDVANRSSIVFYTVDARGLQATSLTAQDKIVNPTPAAINAALSERSGQLLDTQDGLSYLASGTGGFAVLNSNDLSGGVRRVLDDQSYYLVGYEPEQETFDPVKRKFNKLEVRVSRKGANVRYRSGFFNVEHVPLEKIATTMSPIRQLETALTSPFAVSGINLRLNALFGHDAKTGSYVRSLLHVDAGDLKFTDEKDGAKKVVFDVLAMSFGDNGQIVDQTGKSYAITLKPDAYKQIVASGFVYQFTFPVKKPGAYQYRVAIRDTQTGKLGSASQFVEVPNLKKQHLTASSIVIESLTADQWSKTADPNSVISSDPMADTALRRVKSGKVLCFGYEIYNARLNAANQPGLQTKIRVFSDGKLVLDGRQTPLDLHGQTDMLHIKNSGAIAIGDKMPPGDYILQVVVTDQFADPKQQIATQFVQFEVVE